MAPLLQVERSTKRFGGLVANRDVSLAIEEGERVGLAPSGMMPYLRLARLRGGERRRWNGDW